MRVGFIGLGSQGAPMAQRIIEEGHDVALWARRPQTLAPFAATTAAVADSITKLGARSDVVCICVVNDADVVNVVDRPNGVLETMAPGGVVVIHSTVHPDTCRTLAARASEVGVDVVDAPVSGGGIAAAERRLLVMLGGEAEPIARCLPVLEAFGSPIRHLGPLGSGQVAKLLNNMLFTANLATATAALELGEAFGIAKAELAELLLQGTARSQAMQSIAGAGGTLDRLAAVAATLLCKDVSLVADLADRVDAEPGVVLQAADNALFRMGQSR
ncbi:6-phosphogluconate dehydrogenase [Mycobacterium colombiense]|uniref:6-phosphogluconate dehydrogenase n=1 Tax=Mycobacterium colombiense TaxID=339268 RepID=A0A1A2RKX6_9MYCO|nr:NAD(P)-dependent oxidoreductase [Mycobacterium colombiense]OBH52688.1 6-phosphogluconate dehydrogenase [Mycobacterium colombiense]